MFNRALLGRWLYGGLELREMLGVELRWTPSLAVCGVGGAPLSLQVPLEWDCGRTSGNDGKLSLVLLDLRWGMGLGQNFGTICGAGIRF
jgi:hypothetical protein